MGKGVRINVVIEVRLIDSLRKYAPPNSAGVVIVDVPDQITVAGLLQELEIDLSEVKTVIVNGQVQSMDYRLNDGDHLRVLPNISRCQLI